MNLKKLWKYSRVFNNREDLPEETNYISLDNKNLDSDGLPGISVNYNLSTNSRKILDLR